MKFCLTSTYNFSVMTDHQIYNLSIRRYFISTILVSTLPSKTFFSRLFRHLCFFFALSRRLCFIASTLAFSHFCSRDSQKYKKITILLISSTSHNIFSVPSLFPYLFHVFHFRLLYSLWIWELVLSTTSLAIVLQAITFLAASAIES